MRQVMFLLRKEFLQIFRNRAMMGIIFVMPLIQVLVLSFAASNEIRNISLAVVDQDRSMVSGRLITKMTASGYFQLRAVDFSRRQALRQMEADQVDLILEIPPYFERDLVRDNAATLQLTANAINNMKASLGVAYARSIIQDFNQQVRVSFSRSVAFGKQELDIRAIPRFNPHLNYPFFMVPGILVILVTMVGTFLSGMNIVREKELGTIEQLNVTPLGKFPFILGKLLPFWVIGIFELALGLTVGALVFHIPIHENIWVVFAFAAVYLPLVLGIGLLISTFANTQQQAMFLSWFFLVIFTLMSGLFTAVENMPDWAQKINILNPMAYFIQVIRMVMLKGSTFGDIWPIWITVALYGLAMNGLAIWNYRKISR
ncbi:MAG: ABC transporter permease [Chitinophagaceae bacterium]